MEIIFFKKGPNKLGSNRIFIDNFCKYLRESDINSKISLTLDLNEKSHQSICIVSKFASIEDILKIKKKKIKIGVIQANFDKKKIDLADFLIVGSIIEKDAHAFFNKPTFHFPLCEDYNVKKKIKDDNENLILGYHGNLEHLNELDDNFLFAIDKLNKKYNFEFHVIYDKTLGKWKRKPNCIIREIHWTDDEILNFLSYVDIGICPGLRENNSFISSKIIKKIFSKSTKRDNDLVLQFKPNTNSGRAFLFHQHLIPVVADFSPTHFHILSNENNGFLAFSKGGWYNSLQKLIENKNLRHEIAKNAYKTFNEEYSKTSIINNFLDFLKQNRLTI
jgi:glycosyltransferase involved in cell wall biosynthesis